MWTKDQEFTAWLADVKQISVQSHLSNWEKKKNFKDFMEDYNTCTMPSKKYYNLEKYELKKIRKQNKAALKKKSSSEVQSVFNDEEELRLQKKREREQRQQKEVKDKLFETKLNAMHREKDSMFKILESSRETLKAQQSNKK